MTPVDERAVQKAVSALVKALGVPVRHISDINIHCGGTVRVSTRERATFAAAHVMPFPKEDEK